MLSLKPRSPTLILDPASSNKVVNLLLRNCFPLRNPVPLPAALSFGMLFQVLFEVLLCSSPLQTQDASFPEIPSSMLSLAEDEPPYSEAISVNISISLRCFKCYLRFELCCVLSKNWGHFTLLSLS